MLQLLQSKTFGSHRLPEGWVLVAAGNPPEYNRAVREFDVATLDRVRQIDVEPDAGVWMEYAWERGVHGAVLSYLSIRPEHFYQIEEREDGKSFVTARGWEDLSELIRGYEALDVPVTAAVAGEFLRKGETAKSFAAYYQLYRKYGTDYGIPALLTGGLDPSGWAEKVGLAQRGGFEERLTVVQLILDYLNAGFRRYERADRYTTALHGALAQLKGRWQGAERLTLEQYRQQRQESLRIKVELEQMERRARETEEWVLEKLRGYEVLLKGERLGEDEAGFDALRWEFQKELEARGGLIAELLKQVDNAFTYIIESFGDGQELLLLVSGLTRSPMAAAFLSEHPNEAYLAHSEKLLFRQQERELQRQCEELL